MLSKLIKVFLIFVSLELVNPVTISTAELVAVNATIVPYIRITVPSRTSLIISCTPRTILVISGSFDSVHRTDRNTEPLSFSRGKVGHTAWGHQQGMHLL